MTPVSLPLSVPFPVTVTAVHHRVGETVQKHAVLLKFKYWDYQEDPSSKDANPQNIRVERIGTLESPIEGRIEAINVALNDEVAHTGMELFIIEEPCSHTVQYGGLCALCGKAVEDEKDYTGYSYEDRATIEMSHDSTGLRISLEEATKIEHNATSRLAEVRKLILVVDLDQTVIQATVDPTVGKWQLNPNDPNYPYVADVKSFVLEEEPILPRGWTGPKPLPTKCCYYIKLRPGLETFLERVLKLYELHVYTMATRNYALAICKLIDPTGAYFGDRILSRDESGLITHKNLKRLFPVDQSMVAIIDDRGDVWQWEANLVKVVPYDFFVGIGDINLSFLPKKNGQLLGPSKRRKAIARLEAASETDTETFENEPSSTGPTEDSEAWAQNKAGIAADDDADEDGDAPDGGLSDSESRSPSPSSGPDSATSSPIDRMVHLGGGENNESLLVEQQKIRSKLVEQQQHDRPLAKLQEDLDKTVHSDHESSLSDSDDKEDDEHLLSDDDKELSYLETALSRCHSEYYKQYDEHKNNQISIRPDLASIIPKLKVGSLTGLVVLFSGVFALGKNIDDVEIVIWCRQFGVKVVTEVYPDVTHVVCRDPDLSMNKPGLTLKVRVAKKTLPNVKIVSPDWLFACLSQWKPVATSDYEIHVSDRDWYVSDTDVKKYQSAFDLQSQREKTFRSAQGGRSDSLGSIEEFDLNDASEEVDDFLAGISDDSDDNEDENVGGLDDDDDDNTRDSNGSTNGSFVKSLYSAKRKADDIGILEDSEGEDTKRRKVDSDTKESTESTDFDELEQELLDELDHLSD